MRSFIFLSLLCFAHISSALPGQLVSLTPLAADPAETANVGRLFYCPDAAGKGHPVGFHRYKITYETMDLQGHPVNTMGLVLVPDTAGPWPLLIYQHGTMYSRADLPSSNPATGESEASGYCFASFGYLTVLADYLGFGDGTGVHPYLHAASEAWTARDLLRATRQAVVQLKSSLTSQLFIAGYSQGGHAAMALHRLLEQDPSHEFQVTAAADGAGPYDISETAAAALVQPNPAAGALAAYLLAGLNPVYHFYSNVSDVFAPPFADIVATIFDGTHSSADVNAKLSVSATGLLQKTFLQSLITDPQPPLLMALQDNDVYDWLPQAPVHLYHGHGDQTVPYANSEKAYSVMKARGATIDLINLGESIDHLRGFTLMTGQSVLWFETLRLPAVQQAL